MDSVPSHFPVCLHSTLCILHQMSCEAEGFCFHVDVCQYVDDAHVFVSLIFVNVSTYELDSRL